MADNYETTISFKNYNTLWKGINQAFDLENIYTTEYSFHFLCNAPEDMNECIDENGILQDMGEYKADDAFVSNSFNLASEYLFDSNGVDNGFKITLKDDIYLTAYDGVKGYYYEGHFFEDIEHLHEITPVTGHYYFDWTNYDPDASGYGIVTYKFNGTSFDNVDKPNWIDYEGNILIKAILLVNNDNSFVMAYCRFSSYLVVKEGISISKDATFIQVTGDSDG